jgi:hypothetical protein
MSTDTASTTKKRPASPATLLRPEETFWEHYSPHHEFPLATVSAFTLCGLAVLLLLLLGSLGFNWILGGFSRDNETDRPVPVDVVETPGRLGGGGPSDAPGGNPAVGAANQGTELAQGGGPTTTMRPELKKTSLPTALAPNPLALAPTSDPDATPDPTQTDALRNDLKDAENQFRMAAERAAARQRNAASGGTGSVARGTGSGTGGGSGGGTGSGIGTGTGPGIGARAATRQEILAWRWRFDLSGSGEEHAKKLVAMGVTMAVAAPDGKYYMILDLKKRPVDLVAADLSQHRDEVKWFNTRPDSLRNLAAAFGLRFQPRNVVMFLPKDREDQWAKAEQDYMQARGLQTVHATWFDFPFNNGSYQPVVLRIE